MKTNTLKKIGHFLFWCGLGFTTSSVLGLDGFRDTMQFPQLFIGLVAIAISAVLYLIIVHTIK